MIKLIIAIHKRLNYHLGVLLLGLLPYLAAYAEELDVGWNPVQFRASDGAIIRGYYHAGGFQAAILAHDSAYNGSSWQSNLGNALAREGFSVLSINFRGYGGSTGFNNPYDLPQDLIGAVNFLRNRNAVNVSIVGAGLGGSYALRATLDAVGDRQADYLVLISPPHLRDIERLEKPILFVTTENENRRDSVEDYYQRSTTEKELLVLNGGASSQGIFVGPEGLENAQRIVDYLKEKQDISDIYDFIKDLTPFLRKEPEALAGPDLEPSTDELRDLDSMIIDEDGNYLRGEGEDIQIY